MNLIAMSATVVLLLASGIPAGAQGQNLGNVLDKLSGILGGNQQIHGTVVLPTDTTVVVRGDDKHTYALDASTIDPRVRGILQPGDGVTVAVKAGPNRSLVANDVQLDRVKTGAAPGRQVFQQVQGTVEKVTGSQVLFKTRDGLELPVDVSTIVGLPAFSPNQPATLIYDQGPQHKIEAVWIAPGEAQPAAGAPPAVGTASAAGSASPTTEGSERVHGLISDVSLTGLTLQAEDGRKLTVDTGKVNSLLVQALRPGDLVTVVGRMADQPGTFVADSLQPDSLR
jgi:hypothetical protein